MLVFIGFFLGLTFSSPAGFARNPGSKPAHLDLEKLFLLSVSKENLDFRGNFEKNLPYSILNFRNYHILTWMPDLAAFQLSPGRIFHVESEFAVKNDRF